MKTRFRLWIASLTLLLVGLWSQSVRASDYDKYLPADANFYFSINLKKICGSELVRKSLPKLIDKYGENLVKMAAQLNPQAAQLEAVWPMIQEAVRDTDKVNQFFDAAQDAVGEFIVAGNTKKPGDKDFICIITSPHFTDANVEMIYGLISGAQPGMVEKIRVGKKSMFVMSPPDQDEKVYVSLIGEGALAFAVKKEIMEKSLKGSDSVSLPSGMKDLLKSRKGDQAFFFAGHDMDDEVLKAMGSAKLDKNIDFSMTLTLKDGDKAKEKADEMKKELSDAQKQLGALVGGNAKSLQPLIDQMKNIKISADGANIKVSLQLDGSVIEKMLK